MSKIEKRMVEQKRTVIDTVQDGVTIELTQKEAEQLFSIVGNFTNNPTPENVDFRAFTDRLYEQLNTSGVRRTGYHRNAWMLDFRREQT